MFSMLNSAVKLEGSPILSQGKLDASYVTGSEVTDFSDIISGIRASVSDPGKAADEPELLHPLQFSDEQMSMLAELMADGKTLPQAAETALQDLRQALLDNQGSAEISAQLQQALLAIVDMLPEKWQNQFAGKLPLNVLADRLRGLGEKTGKPVHGVLDSTSTAGAKDLSPDDNIGSDENIQSNANAIIITAGLEANSEKQLPSAMTGQPALKPAITKQNSALSTGPLSGPAIFQESYGQLPEPVAGLTSEKQVNQNIPLTGLLNQYSSQRINSSSLAEAPGTSLPAISASAAQANSPGLQSNGFGTSFNQLLSQAIPQPVTQNIHGPDWGGAVGDRIAWMLGNKLHSARLRISPAHLGPLEIKISIEKNIAQVSFISQHQVVRDALEQAVPRLKEMLGEQELDLVNVDINERNQAETDRSMPDNRNLADGSQDQNIQSGTLSEQQEKTADEVSTTLVQTSGLLDAYA